MLLNILHTHCYYISLPTIITTFSAHPFHLQQIYPSEIKHSLLFLALPTKISGLVYIFKITQWTTVFSATPRCKAIKMKNMSTTS